ncbi:MAG: glycoside hydrolase family 2 protein [Chthoniobacterales bacterium]
MATSDLRKVLAKHGVDRVVVEGEIRRGAKVLARNTALFVAPRLLELSLPGAAAFWSDNFFDLLPATPRTVELSGVGRFDAKKIRLRSLVHTAGH